MNAVIEVKAPTPEDQDRSVEAKIARLRSRVRASSMDNNVRAMLLGILDLLGDEL